jgi:hypothetical protein
VTRLAWLALPVVLAAAAPASAQVLKDLKPIRLEYVLFLGDQGIPAGEAWVSFEPTDTERGRRLQVKAEVSYRVGTEDPVEFRQEVLLVCDRKGVEKFDGMTSYGEQHQSFQAVRRGIDYHVTSTINGKTFEKTETAGVQRTNIGLFCGGFLAEPLSEGEMLQDFPLLFPASGKHVPRQKYRVGTYPIPLPSGESLPVIETHLARLDKSRDTLWHHADEYEALVRMVEQGPAGPVVYDLVRVNGEPVDWSNGLPGLP